MPAPIPRQRAVPAAESGQAQTGPAIGGPSGDSSGGITGDSSAAASTAVPGAVSEAVSDVTEAPRPQGTADDGKADDRPADAAPSAAQAPAHGTPTGHLTLLMIEDDPGGSPVVPELVDPTGKPIRVRTARNLTEAERLLTDDVHCILLDLALPAPARAGDGTDDELAVLKHVLRLAPHHAVLALTASGDTERGAEAVRVGAQDYLFRDELDGRLLSRAIRYAVARKRSDRAERKLTESKLRAQENARLERGLLPTPSWRAPRCASPPATAPAAPARCSAATSTTPCAPPTAPCTR